MQRFKEVQERFMKRETDFFRERSSHIKNAYKFYQKRERPVIYERSQPSVPYISSAAAPRTIDAIRLMEQVDRTTAPLKAYTIYKRV